MNKIVKIGGIILGVLFLAAAIMGTIAENSDGPRQSFKFINTSNAVKSVTFEMIEENDSLSGTWYVNEEIQPNSSLIKRIPEGRYKIEVWDEKELLYQETEFSFQLKDPTQSDFQLYRFDLAMDKKFALVYLNAVYSGNALAEEMSKAVGTNSNSLQVEKIYDGQRPFLVSEQYTGRTFIDLEDDLPSSVKYGEVVYGLFHVSNTLTESELYEKIPTQVSKKLQ
jgi:hypothetical protein